MNELYHYGMPRRSGRYPYGSGERPYQGIDKKDTKAVNKALKGITRSKKRFEEEHTIPRGTIMYRATGSKKENLGGSKYVTYLQPDRDLYRAGELKERRYAKQAKNVYEHTLELKEDLKIPSRDIYKESVKSVMTENPDLITESMDTYFRKIMFGDKFIKDLYLSGSSLSENETINNLVKSTVDNLKNTSIDVAMDYISQSIGGSPNTKKAIINDLAAKGYNAMVDEGGVGTKIAEGIEPLIIFDGAKSLKITGTNEVTEKDAEEAGQNYEQWRSRAWKSRRW